MREFRIYKFTGDIEAWKDVPLAGAIFELHKASGDTYGDAISFKFLGHYAAINNYRVAISALLSTYY